MDMRYWIPAGAVSPDEEKETDFLRDETQRTQSQAEMRCWIPAGVVSHSQEQKMRLDLVGDETGSPDMTCKEKKMKATNEKERHGHTPKKHKQLFII